MFLAITILALLLVVVVDRVNRRGLKVVVRESYGRVKYDLPKTLLLNNSKWDSKSSKLPLGVAEARQIADKLAADLESVDPSLSWRTNSIALVPIKGMKNTWCYLVSLDASEMFVAESGLPLTFSAIILMDGKVVVSMECNFQRYDPDLLKSCETKYYVVD